MSTDRAGKNAEGIMGKDVKDIFLRKWNDLNVRI